MSSARSDGGGGCSWRCAGLHTSDDTLRGTALEYLEAVLPDPVRAGLWCFLEDRRGARAAPRSRAEILEELLRSNASIEDNLRSQHAS